MIDQEARAAALAIADRLSDQEIRCAALAAAARLTAAKAPPIQLVLNTVTIALLFEKYIRDGETPHAPHD